MIRTLALAAAAACVAAQPGFNGIVGEWTLIQAKPNPLNPNGVPNPISGNTFGHAVTTAGCFIVDAYDTNGLNNTFQYDPTTQMWTQYQELPAGANTPISIVYGGYVLQFGGGFSDQWNVVNVFDSSLYSNKWTNIQFNTNAGFSFRYGARMVLFGNVLYRFGGCDIGGCYNDLWGLDVGAVVTQGMQSGQAAVGWVPIFGNQPGNTAYPPARRDFVMEVIGHHIVIAFGWLGTGNSHMNDVWLFAPGNWLGPVSSRADAFYGAFTQLSAVPGDASAGLPAPRGAPSHGIYGDNLVVFGGWGNGAGPGSDPNFYDMWALHLPTQTWYPIVQQPGQPWPTPAPQTRTTALFIGRHWYMMVSTVGGGSTTGLGQTQLWTWATPVSPPVGPQGGASCPTYTSSGHTAGIVIGILIGLLNLYFLVVLARNADLLPSFCGGGGVKIPGGFYSSAPSASAVSSSMGGYAPPPVDA